MVDPNGFFCSTCSRKRSPPSGTAIGAAALVRFTRRAVSRRAAGRRRTTVRGGYGGGLERGMRANPCAFRVLFACLTHGTRVHVLGSRRVDDGGAQRRSLARTLSGDMGDFHGRVVQEGGVDVRPPPVMASCSGGPQRLVLFTVLQRTIST